MTFADAHEAPASGADPPLVIPYRPRRHFLPLHASDKRWIFTCAHRRAGKTVALANQLIRAAYLNGRQWPPPRYGYVGPSFEQAKDLVWSYLKQYTQPIDGVRFLEGELAIVLPHNGAILKLYGGMSRLRADARHVFRRHRAGRISAPAKDRVLHRRQALPGRLSRLGGRLGDEQRRRPLQPPSIARRWTTSGGTCS